MSNLNNILIEKDEIWFYEEYLKKDIFLFMFEWSHEFNDKSTPLLKFIYNDYIKKLNYFFKYYYIDKEFEDEFLIQYLKKQYLFNEESEKYSFYNYWRIKDTTGNIFIFENIDRDGIIIFDKCNLKILLYDRNLKTYEDELLKLRVLKIIKNIYNK